MSTPNPMDDPVLAAQWAKTGNLMALSFDEAWLRAADADTDEEFDGPVEAGLALKPYVEALAKVPPEAFRRQRYQVEVLSILLSELETWLCSWNLGLSFEAVRLEAHRRLYERIECFIAEQGAWVEALLAEHRQRLPMEEKTVRAQTTVMLSQLFTQEDWQALADSAAQGMANGVFQIRQSNAVSSIAS